jgi:hypothetical protein
MITKKVVMTFSPEGVAQNSFFGAEVYIMPFH